MTAHANPSLSTFWHGCRRDNAVRPPRAIEIYPHFHQFRRSSLRSKSICPCLSSLHIFIPFFLSFHFTFLSFIFSPFLFFFLFLSSITLMRNEISLSLSLSEYRTQNFEFFWNFFDWFLSNWIYICKNFLIRNFHVYNRYAWFYLSNCYSYTTNVFTFNRIVLDNPEGYSNFRPVYDGYGIIIFKTSQAVYRLPCQTSCVTASIIIIRDPPPTRKRITKII